MVVEIEELRALLKKKEVENSVVRTNGEKEAIQRRKKGATRLKSLMIKKTNRKVLETDADDDDDDDDDDDKAADVLKLILIL